MVPSPAGGMSLETVSVVGLGKLGLCMAGVFAEAGYLVIGVDVNNTLIEMVNNGVTPYIEPRLDDVLANSRGRLYATRDFREAVLRSDLTFIIVATPTRPDGTYGNEQLESALTTIAEVLREKQTKHHIVISCTVMPGTIEREMIPLVEKVSGKKLNEGFSIAYNPEFIAMGNVIKIFTEPDFILIGESEPTIGDELERIFRVICPNNPPVSRMSIINAELTKIALNCYVTTKITYANMLAEMCEAIPGANVDVITGAIGQDERIGSKVLRGGLGFGGPCFPRDNRAFVRLARDHGVYAALADQTHKSNLWQIERLRELVSRELQLGDTVAILGVAYRSDTPLVDESQALQLAEYLSDLGFKVRLHDPVALENAQQVLGGKATYFHHPEDAVEDADAVVVTMMDKQYRVMNLEDFASRMKPGGHLFDLWRMYFGQDPLGLVYHPLGVGPDDGHAETKRKLEGGEQQQLFGPVTAEEHSDNGSGNGRIKPVAIDLSGKLPPPKG